jgi:hypothetical protein
MLLHLIVRQPFAGDEKSQRLVQATIVQRRIHNLADALSDGLAYNADAREWKCGAQ